MSKSIILTKKFTHLVFVSFCFFFHQAVQAETIHCGLKTINVQNGRINQITHEDGTTHSGSDISDYWAYDGKSIKHKLMDEKIQCSTKPKTRNEIISELSSRFIKNPSIHGMDKQEAQWMTSYTANLMKTDNNCHLLVDASKSTQRENSFFIDCNNKAGSPNRYWVSRDDLKMGNSRSPATPISETKAIDICNNELRLKTTNPSTYDPSLLTGTTSRSLKANGRNVVEIDFTAASALGVKGKYRGKCILESGRLIEATIKNL